MARSNHGPWSTEPISEAVRPSPLIGNRKQVVTLAGAGLEQGRSKARYNNPVALGRVMLVVQLLAPVA